MKGFLTAHDSLFRKTHDLDELGRACMEITPTLGAVLSSASDLTVFAWEFRYPGATQVPSVGEAHEALATAQLVYDTLLSTFPPELHP